jgi:uncharacterized protein
MLQVSAKPSARDIVARASATGGSYPRHVPQKNASESEREMEELQGLLDAVPAPLDPLDVSSLDGFLCGVIVQPRRIARERWLAFVTDGDGRPLPAGFDGRRLHELVVRREAELRRAIERREWFDPRVFELDGDDTTDAATDEGFSGAVEAVYPWVAGFAAAMEIFPELLAVDDDAEVIEPLALIYRHLDPDDLEDADALLAEIESLEPPADLGEAVEGLVRATLLLADVARDRSRR